MLENRRWKMRETFQAKELVGRNHGWGHKAQIINSKSAKDHCKISKAMNPARTSGG